MWTKWCQALGCPPGWVRSQIPSGLQTWLFFLFFFFFFFFPKLPGDSTVQPRMRTTEEGIGRREEVEPERGAVTPRFAGGETEARGWGHFTQSQPESSKQELEPQPHASPQGERISQPSGRFCHLSCIIIHIHSSNSDPGSPSAVGTDRTRGKNKGTFRRIFHARVETKQTKCFSRIQGHQGCVSICLRSAPFTLSEFWFWFWFCLFRATPRAYGGSQARGQIRAVADGLCHNLRNTRSELRLLPTSQLTAMPDP